MDKNQDIIKISMLASLACTLQIMESFIPMPFPGIKIGFANLITLLALVLLGFRASLYVALVRTLMSSFVLGTFLTPTFILSSAGALLSALVMGAVYAVNRNYRLFSVIGISIIGALAHNCAQLAIVSVFFIGGKGVLWLAPWLGISALVTGYVTGLIAARTCSKLRTASPGTRAAARKEPCPLPAAPVAPAENSGNMLDGIGFEWKLLALFALFASVLLIKSLLFHALILGFVAGMALLAGVPLRKLGKGVKHMLWLVVLTFVFRALSTQGDPLVKMGFLKITVQGVQGGLTASLRLLILMTGAFVLANTTSPARIIEGLRRILSPLRIIGIDSERLACRVGISWSALPGAWQYTQEVVASLAGRRRKSFRLVIVSAARALVILLRRLNEGKAAYSDTTNT